MIVKKLKSEQFSRLKKVFEEEFASDLPEPQNSEILVVYEQGRMVGFMLAETIVMLGQIYVVPEKRKNSSKIVKNLLDYCKMQIAPKNVVGAVASESRFENLYKAFGMEKIFGVFYRKNL
jgi:hypothetical protein